MTFDDITNDGRLWSVRYDNAPDNALSMLFNQWNDINWLRSFFKANLDELAKMEKVRNFLLAEGVIDNEGFEDYLREL